MQSNAPHGPQCNSQTFPVDCRDCGASIFVFTCDCGSVVLFNELGYPWSKHDCQDIDESFKIDENYGVYIREAEEKRTSKQGHREAPPIKSVSPSEKEEYRGRGVVSDVYRDVDVFNKIGLDEPTTMAEAVLGDLAKQNVTQITVHVEDQGASDFKSYTFLCPRDMAPGDVKGDDFLDLHLEAVSVPGVDNLWKATKVNKLKL